MSKHSDKFLVAALRDMANQPMMPDDGDKRVMREAADMIDMHEDLVGAIGEALGVFIGCCIPAGGVDDRRAILETQGLLRAAIAKARGE